MIERESMDIINLVKAQLITRDYVGVDVWSFKELTHRFIDRAEQSGLVLDRVENGWLYFRRGN